VEGPRGDDRGLVILLGGMRASVQGAIRAAMNRIARLASVAPLPLAAACGGSPGASSDSSAASLGEVSLAVMAVPASVQCIQIVAAGSSTVSQVLPVTTGASTVSMSLGALPLGEVAISGQAYTTACASIAGTVPAWVAAPVSATLVAGKISSVALTFRPDNPVGATGNFIGDVTQVAPGDQDTMIIESDGSLRGTGNSYFASTKTPSVLSAITGIAQVSATSQGGCAVLTGGGVECCGTDVYGQLGNGTQTAPTPPIASVNGVNGAVQVSYANSYACAVTAAGALYCWGSNANGQLGNGSTGVDFLVPVTPSYLPSPVAMVATGGTASGAVTCAVLYNGTTWCWGYGGWGQLGNGGTASSLSPVPVSTLAATKQVVIGQNSACALRDDGTVRCWGSGGNLGTGSTAQSLVPTQIGVSNVSQIAASLETFCALSPAGVQCWGDGQYGETGDGTGASYLTPMWVNSVVAGATSIVASSFGNHFCAALANQTIDCWGQNNNGQLGNGTSANGFLPTPVQL